MKLGHLLPKEKLVVHVRYYPDDDPIDGFRPGGETYKPLSKKVLLQTVKDYLKKYSFLQPPQETKDLIRLYEEACESEWGKETVLTAKQAKKAQADKEYERMERSAQQFADSTGKKLGSVQFIKALKKAISQVRARKEDWNSGERRMEEWGNCRGAGLGADVYFDDLNFENERFNQNLASLQEIWQYLEHKFPILMLRYKEYLARKSS